MKIVFVLALAALFATAVEAQFSRNLSLAGGANISNFEHGSVVTGTGAYTVTWVEGIGMVNVLQGTPVSSALFERLASYRSRPFYKGHEYEAASDSGVTVISAADGAAAGFVKTMDMVRELIVYSDLLICAEGTYGVEIFSLANPSLPMLLTSFDTNDAALGIDAFDDYLFVADRYDGLRIFDIADLESIYETGWLDTPGEALAAAADDGYVYLANGTEGLLQVDVTNPGSPSVSARLQVEEYVHDVSVAGNFVYAADRSGVVRAIDISRPGTMAPAGFYHLIGDIPAHLQADDRFIFVTTPDNGLMILANDLYQPE